MKKRTSKARLTEIKQKIDVQRRRAARPTLPINTHAPVSKSLAEKKKSADRKARRARVWDDD